MILICPSCGTRFFLDDSRIAPGGRRVQCDACGEVWKALGVSPAETPITDVARFDAPTPASPPAPFAEVSEDSEPLFAPTPAFAQKRRPPPAPATPAIGRLGWIMAALLILVIVAIVVLNEREWIVRVWPPSAAFFKAGGLPVAPAPSAPAPLPPAPPHPAAPPPHG